MGLSATQWGAHDAATLRAVRAYLGQSQSECARALRALGATVGQGAVSGWETGKHVPHPDAIVAIELYCSAVELPGSGSAAGAGDAAGNDAGRAFANLIGTITGERPLSDRQAAAIDALIKRIANGPSFSAGDQWAAETLLRLLALADEHEVSR